MKFGIIVNLCLIWGSIFFVDADQHNNDNGDERKLFGGYRITPRSCKVTKRPVISLGGPTVCMFNHECLQREGQVVGACMDGFLFGACCELPQGVSTGNFLHDELATTTNVENNLLTKQTVTAAKKPPTTAAFDVTNGVSQITASLLNPSVLPTAEDNEIFQIKDSQSFATTGVTHQNAPDVVVFNNNDNEIDPSLFKPTPHPDLNFKQSTPPNMDRITPLVSISISNAPLEYTTVSGFHRPIFRPNPSNGDKFVLVPTISHEVSKLNKTEYETVINIIEWLNSTSPKPPSTSYVYSSLPTKRPGYETISSIKPPSTSYIFSSTVPTRKTQPTTIKAPSTSYVFSSTVPPRRAEPTTKRTNTKPTRKTTPSFIYSLAPAKTTLAYSPDAFSTSAKPPSTSYVYSQLPTKRPPSTVETFLAGPGFTVSSSPIPSPAPTLIVLGSIDPDTEPAEQKPSTYEQISPIVQRPTTNAPHHLPTPVKPINHVTINNHITQNIYSTSEKPFPTVLITPKPSIITSSKPVEESDTVEIVASGSADDLNNFPPDRNPNLNLSSLNTISENDITTPVFIEDEQLDKQVESFVNRIVQGLQEPFQGLQDVVNNKNNATILKVGTTTLKPKQGTTTRKPLVTKPNAAKPTTKPVAKPTGSSSSNVRPVVTSKPAVTRKPTTKKPSSSNSTKKQTSTTKKPKTSKKPVTTTTESYIVPQDNNLASVDPEDYKTQCGIRPLYRASRIVGGKGAIFGEFPWQVLVRESTWLGLFTKNKCGGVLISHKYVMTAAHCQPGFLASLVAVFGEFDISGDKESKRSISRNVKRVIVHRQYDPATFENDLALLEMEQPVQFDSHIVPVCLPRDDDDFTGRLATVTGWGRLKYNGGVPQILQEVQVPIMENSVCQEMFRTAGHTKVILESFLCAGYANGQKDSCEGDSGGPLVLERPDGRYQLAGTVSHGIKCAAPYLPGVYMRTQFFKPWITSVTGVTSP